MKQATRRTFSIVLILVLLLSVLSPVAFAAQRNTGTRHELCTSLSPQAVAYYTGDYSPDALVSYDTDTTGSCLKAVDSELYNVLQSLMTKTMTRSVSYDSLKSYWRDTDCTNNSSNAVLFYSDQVSGNYNREHVWPKSRASFLEQNGGCDLHHLRPTNSGVNSARKNYTFANVRELLPASGTDDYDFDGRTVLWYNGSYTEKTPEEIKANESMGLVEINDNVKGDTARILLYVYTRWEEKNLFENDPNAKIGPSDNKNNGLRVMYDLETLLQWCEMDPVDTWEMSRNDASQAVQGNRNVFIDYPELAWLLFGEVPPADMDVPEKLPLNMSTYTITATSNNTDWGTVTQKGRQIIANPKEGYFAEDYTILNGSATVTRNGNTFTVKAESDCTIRINFVAKKVVTATFNGGVAPISTYTGETITLPSATAPQNYRFVGWVTEAVEETTERPVYYETGTKITMSANMNFLALYAYSENGSGFDGWVLVEDTSELRSGIRLVLASADNNVVAAPINEKYFAKTTATFSKDGKTIEYLPDEAVIMTLGGETGNWTLTGADGKLLGAVANKNVSWDKGTTTWDITVTDGNAEVYSTNTSYGRFLYNRSSPRFTTYTNPISTTLLLPQLYTLGGGIVYYTTTIAECDHTRTTYYNAKEATCTEDGNIAYYVCTCGKYFADEACTKALTLEETVIKATGHDYATATVLPTCTEGGYTIYSCVNCDDSYDDDFVVPYGHTWDEGKVTLAPTQFKDGIKTYTCIICEETKEETIAALHGCEYGEDCGSLVFTDMPELSDWAHAGIDFVVERGLFNGVTKNTFAPDETMTRAMLVTVLWRNEGEPEADDSGFSDVPTNLWYSKAVAWAAEQGVVNGYTDGTFRPDDQITREQLATVLFRYAKLFEMDPPERADLNSFPDSKDVQSYAVEAFQWAVGKGLVNGVRDSGTGKIFLRPSGSATRAQVATILMRFLNPNA